MSPGRSRPWPSRKATARALALLASASLAVVAAGSVNAVAANDSTSAAKAHKGYGPPVFDSWGIQNRPRQQQGNLGLFHIHLGWRGSASGTYPALKTGAIPKARLQLLEDPGVYLLNSGIHKSKFSIAKWKLDGRKGSPPASELRWTTHNGRPTWTTLDIDVNGIIPNVSFWAKGQPGQCITARVIVMQKHGGHWVRIPHSPPQTATACLPGVPATTTTSSP